MKLRLILFLNIAFFGTIATCQTPNHEGFSYFSKYQNRLISDETMQKHSFSIGTGISAFSSKVMTPIISIENGTVDNRIPISRIGLGYHYIFLKKKKLTFFSKERYEFSGFSAYINLYNTLLNSETYTYSNSISDSVAYSGAQLITPQAEFRLTYTNTLLSYRGKVFNFYFLQEFGLSAFRGTSNALLNLDEKITKTFINIVPFSLRFGKRPVFIKSTFNVARNNSLLKRERISGVFGLELQIYFYSTKR